jgi:hypothetical protein
VLEVVMAEPTDPVWFPVAMFFNSRGHIAPAGPSAKAHDMR